MTIEERILLIKNARAALQLASNGLELPQIDAILRSADMELHWALWNLGEPVSIRPEAEFSTYVGPSHAG